MDNEFEKLDIFQIIEGRRSNAQIVIAREFPLTIILNEQELVTLLCSLTD
jgi:formate dehydrogenase assembly factor FdhD